MAFDAPVTESPLPSRQSCAGVLVSPSSAHIRLLPSLLCPLGMTAC